MTFTYSFRPGARVTGVDAQTVGQELERISDDHGELTASLVVDEARPDHAPLHPAFEWNDEIAAELHRQHQARTMIRAVQIVQEHDGRPEPVYVHVSGEGSYLPVEKVVELPDLYEQAYRDACDRLGQAQHSLDQLAEMADRYRPSASKRTSRAAASLKKAHLELTSA